jgi:hypothetical protein
MTLSLGGEWSLHLPSPLVPRIRHSAPRRSTAGAPAPRPPRPPGDGRPPSRGWLPWRRSREVAVVPGTVRSLEEFSEQAARPNAAVDERADAIVLTLDAPGALPKNTDVVWDEERQRLVVGVWAGERPGRSRPGRAPELAWYRSHWLPRCEGLAARVTVRDDTIEIVVPRLETGHATRNHAAPPPGTP